MGLTGEEIMFTSTSSKTNWDETVCRQILRVQNFKVLEEYSKTLARDEDHSRKVLKAS